MHISRSMFFIGIEINSRWAFIEPLWSGHVQEWMTSINHLREANKEISRGRDVWCLMFDDQFSKSKEFEIYWKQNHLRGIGFVASSMHQYHGNKLGFIDRLTRTIKWYLTKLESERESEEMTLNEKVSFCLNSYNSSPLRACRSRRQERGWVLAKHSLISELWLIVGQVAWFIIIIFEAHWWKDSRSAIKSASSCLFEPRSRRRTFMFRKKSTKKKGSHLILLRSLVIKIKVEVVKIEIY
jgi:hypothetical protein